MTQLRYMLIFSIGPVQSLISQARKTRDLWLGSYLLAKLMEAGMEHVQQLKGQFVFPTIQTVDGYIPDLPNKYIALFNTDEEAKSAADQSIKDIKRQWKIITQQVQAKVFYSTSLLTSEVKSIWDQQTNFDTFFEVYWIAEPEPTEDELKEEQAKPGNEGKTHYQLWLEKAQKSFDARKRLRNFQWQNEPGEKSTVSGEREVLHGAGKSREATREFWRTLSRKHPIKDIYHDGSERLDAIDTVKRFALYSDVLQPKKEATEKVDGESSKTNSEPELIKMDFPSTSSIATASFVKLMLEKIQKEQEKTLTAALNEWLGHTNKGGLAEVQPQAIPYLYQMAKDNEERKKILKRDGDCFFEATFVPETFNKMYPSSNSHSNTKINVVEVTEALEGLQKAVGAHPTPYYALIQMDGDHMGTIINGVKEQDKHQAISAALSDFARKQAPEIVQEKHPGRLVYAGGDDVLAFSPLIGLLNMVDTLQKQYKEIVRQSVPDDTKEEVTASMGIAIAHHFTPLSLVRQAAFEAEKLAKNRYGRNALVVTVLRRSGEQTRVGCRWHYDELKPEEQPLPLFQEFYRLFIEDKLSVSSIHILLDEASALVGLPEAAQQSEIKRVLQRQRKNDKVLLDQKANELAWTVVHLSKAMDTVMNQQKATDDDDKAKALSLNVDKRRAGLIEVFGWLLVMVFLAREERGLEPSPLQTSQEEVKQ